MSSHDCWAGAVLWDKRAIFAKTEHPWTGTGRLPSPAAIMPSSEQAPPLLRTLWPRGPPLSCVASLAGLQISFLYELSREGCVGGKLQVLPAS